MSYFGKCAAAAYLASLLLAVPAAAQPAQPGAGQIRYFTEDYPPSNFVENGTLKGYAVDLLKAMWRQMKVPEQPIEVTNWARAFNHVENTPDTMLFAMTRNAEREKKFLWVGPIYNNRYVLIGRTDRKYDVSVPADAGRYRVGVIRDDIGHKLMLEAGVTESKLEKVADFRQLVKMLKADRIDLIAATITVLPSFAGYGDFKASELAPVATVKEAPLYFAFNKDTDARLVARFQNALRAVEPERRRALKAFGLTP